MKLLFDQNISFRDSKKLEDEFPGCKHVSDCGLMNCPDSDIWTYAKQHEYPIATFDADFYDISVISGHPPKIIWIRTGNQKEIIKNFLNNKNYSETSCLELYHL